MGPWIEVRERLWRTPRKMPFHFTIVKILLFPHALQQRSLRGLYQYSSLGSKNVEDLLSWILVVNLANKKSKLTWWNNERKHILTEMINNTQLIIDYVYSLIPLSVERGANENREKRQPFFLLAVLFISVPNEGLLGSKLGNMFQTGCLFFCCTLFPNTTLGY